MSLRLLSMSCSFTNQHSVLRAARLLNRGGMIVSRRFSSDRGINANTAHIKQLESRLADLQAELQASKVSAQASVATPKPAATPTPEPAAPLKAAEAPTPKGRSKTASILSSLLAAVGFGCVIGAPAIIALIKRAMPDVKIEGVLGDAPKKVAGSSSAAPAAAAAPVAAAPVAASQSASASKSDIQTALTSAKASMTLIAQHSALLDSEVVRIKQMVEQQNTALLSVDASVQGITGGTASKAAPATERKAEAATGEAKERTGLHFGISREKGITIGWRS